MSNPQCEYCKNTYSKYGLKPHYNRCKEKAKYDHEQQMIEVAKKRFNENSNEEEKITLNTLPTELIFSITGFLFDKKDDFCSYRQFYKDYLNICLISKRFYNIFYPNPDIITSYMLNVSNESKKIICKSTAKNEYNLKEREIDEIDCEYVKNPHYSSSPPMRLYKIANILDYLRNKYGSKGLYDDFQKRENERKLLLKEKRDVIIKKRENLIDELQKKYKNVYSFRYDDDNEDYLSYISSGSPGIKTIETNIIEFVKKRNREESIRNRIKDIDLYDFLNIVDKYIEGKNNYTEDEVFEIMTNAYNRYNNIKNEIESHNLNYIEQLNNERTLIYNYIYYNNHTIEEIINHIMAKQNRRINIINEFSKNNLHFEYTNEIIRFIECNEGSFEEIVSKLLAKKTRRENLIAELNKHELYFDKNKNEYNLYIETGEGSIEKIINNIIELRFYRQHTTYSIEYAKVKSKYGKANNENNIAIAKNLALTKLIKDTSSLEELLEKHGLDKGMPHEIYEFIIANYNSIKNKPDETINIIPIIKRDNSCYNLLCKNMGNY